MNAFEIFCVASFIVVILALGVAAWIKSGKAKDTFIDITLYINRQIRRLKWKLGI
jgi:hypothetical protein